MANDEDVDRLRQEAAVWNNWRAQNPERPVDLEGANLRGADLRFKDLSGANLRGADLSLANLSLRDLIRADASGLVLFEAKLFAKLHLPNLRGANLDEANLCGANLSLANLKGANLHGADLSEADLSEADLSEADLHGADFHGTNLSGADLQGQYLDEANLCGANLREAKLGGTNLWRADLRGADLRFKDLSGANLDGANLDGAKLGGTNLKHAILIGTNLTDADVAGCCIYGISAWDLKLEGAIQRDLVITRPDQPQITVDNIEVAQFIYLLLHNEKIRGIIDTIGKKGVLLLGRFTEGRLAVLERLREELRNRDFVPIVFNFDKPETKDFTETVRLLAGLSRFVIADITNPRSAPLELQATVPEYMIPFVPIIEDGEEPFAMFQDLWGKHREWVLDPIAYGSVDELVHGLDEEIIKPALAMFDELVVKKAEKLKIRRIGTGSTA